MTSHAVADNNSETSLVMASVQSINTLCTFEVRCATASHIHIHRHFIRIEYMCRIQICCKVLYSPQVVFYCMFNVNSITSILLTMVNYSSSSDHVPLTEFPDPLVAANEVFFLDFQLLANLACFLLYTVVVNVQSLLLLCQKPLTQSFIHFLEFSFVP